ncbi:hypothetical protein MMC10_009735 [Thelotrema lepadinum]|nr:hypothetical protein [Thelotrema lepadinum]
MRTSILLPAAFAVSSLALPALVPRALVTDWVATTTVYITVTAGEPGASLSSLPVHEHTHHHHHSGKPLSTSSTIVVSSTPLVTSPSATPVSPSSSPFSTSTPIAPPSSTPIVVPSPSTSSTPIIAPSPSSSTAAASSPTSTGSTTPDGSPLNGGVTILSTINKWRTAYSLNNLTWSDGLTSDALATGKFNNGGDVTTLQHPGGYPDSFAEVITPGMTDALSGYNLEGDTPFELAWVSWLCEVSTDPELQASGFSGVDQCGVVSKVLNMQYSGTGHHDILTSGSYQTVGCAYVQNPAWTEGKDPYEGLWSCDFGFDS